MVILFNIISYRSSLNNLLTNYARSGPQPRFALGYLIHKLTYKLYANSYVKISIGHTG